MMSTVTKVTLITRHRKYFQNLPYLAVIVTGIWNAFFYWPICASVLSKSNVGYLGSMLSVANIVAPILLLSLNVFITRELADEESKMVALALSTTVRWYLLAMFLLVAGGHAFFGMPVAFTAMIAQATLIWALAVFRGLFQPARYFVLATSSFGVIPTLVILNSTRLNLSIGSIILAQSISIFALSFLLLGRVSSPNLALSLPCLRRALRTTSLGTVALIATVLLFQAGRPLISHMEGTEAAAEFQFSSAIGVGLLTAMVVLGEAVLPGFYSLGETPWVVKINSVGRIMSRWIIPVTALLMLVGYQMTKVICPYYYPVSHIAIVASVIVLAVCPVALGSVSYSALVYLRRGNILAVPALTSVAIFALLCIVLRQQVSIRVAFAMVVALSIRTLMQSFQCETSNGRLNLFKPQIAPISICLATALFALLHFG